MRSELENKKDYLNKLEKDAQKLTKEEQFMYGSKRRIDHVKQEILDLESN